MSSSDLVPGPRLDVAAPALLRLVLELPESEAPEVAGAVRELLRELGRVRVGPYYTNTREGLKMARRILERQRKDMRQIIMITDGKPSAIREFGKLYKNPFGLDPKIVNQTLAEAAVLSAAAGTGAVLVVEEFGEARCEGAQITRKT